MGKKRRRGEVVLPHFCCCWLTILYVYLVYIFEKFDENKGIVAEEKVEQKDV
jgi:hypothetical protein